VSEESVFPVATFFPSLLGIVRQTRTLSVAVLSPLLPPSSSRFFYSTPQSYCFTILPFSTGVFKFFNLQTFFLVYVSLFCSLYFCRGPLRPPLEHLPLMKTPSFQFAPRPPSLADPTIHAESLSFFPPFNPRHPLSVFYFGVCCFLIVSRLSQRMFFGFFRLLTLSCFQPDAPLLSRDHFPPSSMWIPPTSHWPQVDFVLDLVLRM